FASIEDLHHRAGPAFDKLTGADWAEAFIGHPRIGERGDATANREQGGTAGAGDQTLGELAEVNRAYEERFGLTYIVYASGKTTEEMLAIARTRLGSTKEEEIATAAAEQRRITDTRLRRMTCQEPS
ncbi:MAG TPA: 2-oxo-4-hydroxy-4-carboxy-5-ureidoimidazoline decarboxylase, partial [Acidimicrobiia bacterium]